MPKSNLRWSDERVEMLMGNLLRIGVIIAAIVVFLGGVIYMFKYGHQPFGHHVFRGEPSDLRSLAGIIDDARSLHSRGIIQIGLLMLIATPVARVIFSIFAFAVQRDRTYVVVTTIVLAILLYSLSGRGF